MEEILSTISASPMMPRLLQNRKRDCGKVTTANEKFGLHLNLKKTKIMSSTGMRTFKTKDGDIEVVNHFNLLGSVLDEDGGYGRELMRRLAMGRAMMTGLMRI